MKNKKRMNKLDGKTWYRYSFSIWRDIKKTKDELKLKHPAMFPEQLTSRFIKIFTKEKGEVIIDPFMGSGSTIVSAMKLGKKSIGFEISSEYRKMAKDRIKSVQLNLKNFEEEMIKPEIHKDARNLLDFVEPNSVDLCITSPPYWDILTQKRTADRREIRKYTELEKDLGNIHDYDMFLSELETIFDKVFQVLRKDKRCIVIVMDIRKKNKFYPLHIDLTRIMEEVGFELEDFIIWDRQHEYHNMIPLGYPYVFRVNKVHEYICIYLKK